MGVKGAIINGCDVYQSERARREHHALRQKSAPRSEPHHMRVTSETIGHPCPNLVAGVRWRGARAQQCIPLHLRSPTILRTPAGVPRKQENRDMLSVRKVFAATALTIGLAAPAFAQNISMELSDRQAMMITPSGKVMRMNVGAAGHAMMMKHGQPVKAGTIFYMSGGKLYWTQDRSMEGGKMLHDALVETF